MDNAKTNYIDLPKAKMVNYDRNIPRDDSGGAEGVSEPSRFGDGGKITASKSNFEG